MSTPNLSRDELLCEVQVLESQHQRLIQLSIPTDQQVSMTDAEIDQHIWLRNPDFAHRYSRILSEVFADLRI